MPKRRPTSKPTRTSQPTRMPRSTRTSKAPSPTTPTPTPSSQRGNGRARPRPRGGAANTSGTRTRRAIELRSYSALAWLAGKPPWLPALALGVLLVAGLWLGGVAGGVLLALVAAYVGWLAYLSWPAVDGRGRFARLLTVVLLLVVAVGTAALD